MLWTFGQYLVTQIVGIDEVGRGPLCGPVLAAAVILDDKHPIQGIKDSKALSEKKRLDLATQIQEKSYAWALGRADVEEIDQLNILQASLLAMKRAYEALKAEALVALVDGNRAPQLLIHTECMIKGDSQYAAIAAASILAKVTRDQEMQILDSQYPGYGLAVNKGYPTEKHRKALIALGPTPCHRLSFEPVKKAKAIQESELLK